MADFKVFLGKVASGASLSRDEAAAAFDMMMSGLTTPAQIGGFLMALRVRGESVDEIAGAVSSMRTKMLTVAAPDNAIDIVGTGGDASGSYNISTATAFVVAGAGVPVAKHGNRALSSRSGAADVLAALGVRIDLAPEAISRCIAHAGIGFMFAPMHHSAMRHVGPSRVELGTRTIFNLLGPLSNPANVRRQLLGVFAQVWLEPLAHVLRELGAEKIFLVHGADGMDEISPSGPTVITALEKGQIHSFSITPEDFGLPVHPPEAIKGGDAEENAAALLRVLAGEAGAYRDSVLLNAAAALYVADAVKGLRDGLALAEETIRTGRAQAALDRLIAESNTVLQEIPA